MVACEAPISHLLISCGKPTSFKNPVKALKFPVPLKLNTRRLLLFSLPLSSILLLQNTVQPRPSSRFGTAFGATFDPVTQAEKDASAALSQRLSEALELLEKGRELQALGDFTKALDYFTLVIYFFFYYHSLTSQIPENLIKYS